MSLSVLPRIQMLWCSLTTPIPSVFVQPIRLYLVSDCYVGLDQEHEIRGAA